MKCIALLNIVVTGASSFLGRHLVASLAEENCIIGVIKKMHCCYNGLPEHDNITYLQCEMNNIESLVSSISNADIFVHFAWDGAGIVGRYNRDEDGK